MSEQTNGHAVDADGDPLFPDEIPIPRFPLMSVTIRAVSPPSPDAPPVTMNVLP